jgi:hypothetical protein
MKRKKNTEKDNLHVDSPGAGGGGEGGVGGEGAGGDTTFRVNSPNA